MKLVVDIKDDCFILYSATKLRRASTIPVIHPFGDGDMKFITSILDRKKIDYEAYELRIVVHGEPTDDLMFELKLVYNGDV